MNKTAICGLRAALGIVFLLILLALGALILVGNYFYTFALDPNAKGGFGSAAGIVDSEYTRWLLKDSRDVSLISDDGLELHAYRVDGSVPHRYAVLCHGYQNNATGMASYGKHLFDLGYTVLLPDARGHGESEGDYIGMGWPERRDVVRWCQQLIAEDPEAEIVLYGVSMGAATVMMASGEADLPVQVRCVIEDCGYTSVWDEFSGQLKELFGLPPFPVLNAADLVCRIRAGYSITEASALRQVERSVTPTLFIHGDLCSFLDAGGAVSGRLLREGEAGRPRCRSRGVRRRGAGAVLARGGRLSGAAYGLIQRDRKKPCMALPCRASLLETYYRLVVSTFFRRAKRGRAFSLGASVSPWIRGST